MRAVSAVTAGLALALLVVGLALYPMLHPTFTRLLSQRYSQVAESGLSRSRVTHLAEQVREFVADGDVASLPATVDGRAGFDAAAVSHLRDVRRVLAGARTVTGVLAALVALWLGVEIVRKHYRDISSAMFVGAGLCLAIVVVGALAGTVNFDSLFAWFHGLFFSAGTWEFPADSLLIEVFPEGFWVAAGLTWGALVLLGGAVLGGGAWLTRGSDGRASNGSANGQNVNGA